MADREVTFEWPKTWDGWLWFTLRALYIGLCAFVFIAAALALAPPVFNALCAVLWGDALGSTPNAYEDFLRYYRPSVLLFAGLVAALSIPLVLYRAQIQTRSVVQAEKDGRRDQERLQNDRDEAVRQSQTERRLRAIEMLGATLPEQYVEERGVRGARLSRAPLVLTRQVPNMEVRLGALSVLEELAKEPVPDRKGGQESLANHWPVMETVLAYLRRRRGDPDALWAPFHAAHAMPAGYDGWDESVPKEARIEAPVEERVAYAKAKAAYARTLKPEDDCAAAIAILRRRSAAQHAHELGIDAPHPVIDWKAFDAANPEPEDDAPLDQRAELRAARASALDKLLGKRNYLKKTPDGAWRAATPIYPHRAYDRLDLAASALAGGDLSTAILTRLALPGARLEGANLRSARLSGADLSEARMEGATLFAARMESAALSKAWMGDADLSLAKLTAATLTQARLEGATLFGAKMERADLAEVRMEGATLMLAQMEGATLSDARIEGADLLGARMEGATLTDARMEGAMLVGAIFSSAQGLSQEAVSRAYGDAATVLPDDLERPDHWSKEKLDIIEADVEWARWRKAEGFPTLPQHKIYER